jgi:small subunit ribosomal protein S16
MATAIRLKRGGRTHNPYYRVVVMDSRAKDTGKVIEELGHYHPCARPEPSIEINDEAAMKWLRTGAQPSATCKTILKKRGLLQKLSVEKAGGKKTESE